MSTYTATVRWSRKAEGDFTKGQYSRAHEWAFDGGAVVPASAEPARRPGAAVATRRGRSRRRPSSPRCRRATCCSSSILRGVPASSIDRYVDEAAGMMEKRADGKIAMTKVTLRPKIKWGGDAPDEAAIADSITGRTKPASSPIR